MTRTPGFDAVGRAIELLHGTQRSIVVALVEGRQPDATSLGVSESELADAESRLIDSGMAHRVSSAGVSDPAMIELTPKGSEVAEILRTAWPAEQESTATHAGRTARGATLTS
jgi:hypothetical protein